MVSQNSNADLTKGLSRSLDPEMAIWSVSIKTGQISSSKLRGLSHLLKPADERAELSSYRKNGSCLHSEQKTHHKSINVESQQWTNAPTENSLTMNWSKSVHHRPISVDEKEKKGGSLWWLTFTLPCLHNTTHVPQRSQPASSFWVRRMLSIIYISLCFYLFIYRIGRTAAGLLLQVVSHNEALTNHKTKLTDYLHRLKDRYILCAVTRERTALVFTLLLNLAAAATRWRALAMYTDT